MSLVDFFLIFMRMGMQKYEWFFSSHIHRRCNIGNNFDLLYHRWHCQLKILIFSILFRKENLIVHLMSSRYRNWNRDPLLNRNCFLTHSPTGDDPTDDDSSWIHPRMCTRPDCPGQILTLLPSDLYFYFLQNRVYSNDKHPNLEIIYPIFRVQNESSRA